MQATEAEIIKQKADELAEYTKQAEEIKSKIENLKSFFEKLSEKTLTDTKLKTAEYWGNQNTKVTVSNSGTVKPVSIYMLKQVFGDIFSDFIKEDVKYKMTDPCKRLLSAVWQGEIAAGKLEDTVKSISDEQSIQKILCKKLKGKFDRDKATLINIAGLSEQEASDWAYLISEVINYEQLAQVLQSANWGGRFEDALQIMRAAVIVDESIKVTVETED